MHPYPEVIHELRYYLHLVSVVNETLASEHFNLRHAFDSQIQLLPSSDEYAAEQIVEVVYDEHTPIVIHPEPEVVQVVFNV